ncbi:MAG: hypothetical protein P8177_10625, partial [Gemmatimonadota bacterium]
MPRHTMIRGLPFALLLPAAFAQGQATGLPTHHPDRQAVYEPEQAASQGAAAACDPMGLPGLVWWGRDRHMTARRLVSYAAPVIWFSP